MRRNHGGSDRSIGVQEHTRLQLAPRVCPREARRLGGRLLCRIRWSPERCPSFSAPLLIDTVRSHSTGVALGYVTPAALSVARVRAGVIGASRMRTPVASKNAFAIAAGTAAIAASPAPVGAKSVRCTTL